MSASRPANAAVARAIIVGDSLAMVRPDDGIQLRHTYAYLLQQQFAGRVHVHNASRRAQTSRMILESGYFSEEHVRPTEPDLVVLHVGIVDCTPRIFTDRERQALSLLARAPLGAVPAKWLTEFASARRGEVTRRRRITLVPVDEFQSNLRRFVHDVRSGAPRCEFQFVEVCCPTGTMAERNYAIVDRVREYNQAARLVVEDVGGVTIPLFAFTRSNPGVLLADGYHLGIEAHTFIARELGNAWHGILP